MKQEDKDLLLQDLCARLSYATMCATTDNDGSLPNIWEIVKADMLNENFFLIHDSYEASTTVDVKEVRPYLLPLSSMTKEQKREYHQSTSKDIGMLQDVILERINGKDNNNKHAIAYNGIDWLNAHHFDYRGLIEAGLAIDATGLNIY